MPGCGAGSLRFSEAGRKLPKALSW